MKNLIITSILFILAFTTGCINRATANAGEEIVLIKKPWFFGHGGVVDEPVKSGATWVAWSTSEIPVTVQPIQIPEHFDDLMSLDGVPLDFDAVIRVQVTNSVELIRNFGVEWYKTNIQSEFRNRVRQAVRKHGMNETAISSKAIDEIDAEVTEAVEKYLVSAKLPVRLVQVTVGRANPPDSIKNQRVETAAQEQRVNTERQRKLAEDSRLAAEESRAKADNAYRNAMQLSPDQFLKLEAIKMKWSVCQKNNCSFIETSGNSTPLVNVK